MWGPSELTTKLLFCCRLSQFHSHRAPKWTTLALLFYADESICSSELFLKAFQIRQHFSVFLLWLVSLSLWSSSIFKHTRRWSRKWRLLIASSIYSSRSTFHVISTSVCLLIAFHEHDHHSEKHSWKPRRIFHASCWANLPCSIIHLLEKLMTLNFS